MAKTERGATRPWNDQGIRRAARDLGVCHSHLWRVLNGHRTSARLIRRYEALPGHGL
jgi:hypothetical protein